MKPVFQESQCELFGALHCPWSSFLTQIEEQVVCHYQPPSKTKSVCVRFSSILSLFGKWSSQHLQHTETAYTRLTQSQVVMLLASASLFPLDCLPLLLFPPSPGFEKKETIREEMNSDGSWPSTGFQKVFYFFIGNGRPWAEFAH